MENGDPMEAINRLGERFKIPLDSTGVELDQLKAEFCEMISYANQFISISTMDYQCVWWRLYHAPDASSWSNILQLARLLFTLPVSNGKLEDKRSSLGNKLLDDLLTLNTDRVPLKDFNLDQSISLWWSDKVRRPNQKPRKKYAARCSLEQYDSDSEESDHGDLLEEWDEWLDN